MRNRPYCFAALLALLTSCQPKENKVQLRAINKNLEYSNDVIKEASYGALMEMEEKQYSTRIWRKRDEVGFDNEKDNNRYGCAN